MEFERTAKNGARLGKKRDIVTTIVHMLTIYVIFLLQNFIGILPK